MYVKEMKDSRSVVGDGDFEDENDNQVILAPMVRGSELAFRQMIYKYGVKHCYSPMLRASEVVKTYHIYQQQTACDHSTTTNNDNDVIDVTISTNDIPHEDGILFLTDICGITLQSKTLKEIPSMILLRNNDNKNDKNNDICNIVRSTHKMNKLTVQLCGSCPDTLYEATKIILQMQPQNGTNTNELLVGIDLNLGCPQTCAQDGGFGAFLPPSLALDCIRQMKRAVLEYNNHNKQNIQLSSKIRLYEDIKDTIQFAKQLHMAGCDILAVHCRTRDDTQHSSIADWKHAGKQIVQSLSSIPVILNGADIACMQDAHTVLSITQASHVMVARNLLAQPRLLHTETVNPAELAAEYLDHCEHYPPPSALYIRKHFRWFFRSTLQPPKEQLVVDYRDWKTRLWTFLVRPYLETIYQFRQIIMLYVQLSSNTPLPQRLKQHSISYPNPTFSSIRRYKYPTDELMTTTLTIDSTDDNKDDEIMYSAESITNLFQ